MSSEIYHPNETHFEKHVQEGIKFATQVEEIGYMLKQTDTLIAEIGLSLNSSQPISPGKVGLRWWIKNSRSAKRSPQFVEWKKNYKEIYYPVPIKGHLPKRAKNYSAAFKVNHKETIELLEFADQLLQTRAALIKFLESVKKALLNLNKTHKPVLEFQSARLKEIQTLIRANNAKWDDEKDEVIALSVRERESRRKYVDDKKAERRRGNVSME